MALLDIPAELFERIAELADAPSLCALRLVCRDANQKAFRTFRDTHFTTRRTYLAEDDLRTLISIVHHPLFGPAIRKLEICVDEVDVWGRKYGMQQANEAIGWYPSAPSLELEQARSTQRIMRINRTDSHLLTVIFCKLRWFHKLSEIILLDSCQTSHSIAKRPGLERRAPPLWSEAPFTAFTDALMLSRIQFETLTMRMLEWSVPTHRITIDSTSFQSMLMTFMTVKHLTLSLWHDFTYLPSSAENFASMLTSCDQLETLVIHFKDYCEDYDFETGHMDQYVFTTTLIKHMHRLRLEKFSLSGGGVELDDLVSFLRLSDGQPGIVSVELKNVYVTGRSDLDIRPLEEVLRSQVQLMRVSCVDCEDDGTGASDDGDNNAVDGNEEEDDNEDGNGDDDDQEAQDNDDGAGAGSQGVSGAEDNNQTPADVANSDLDESANGAQA